MRYTVKDVFKYAVLKNPLKLKEAVNSVLHQKISALLEEQKKEMAKTVYEGPDVLSKEMIYKELIELQREITGIERNAAPTQDKGAMLAVLYARRTNLRKQLEANNLFEGVMDDIRNIVSSKQFKTVRFEDGTTAAVDLETASAIVAVHEGLKSESNRRIFEQKLSASTLSFMNTVNWVWKQV